MATLSSEFGTTTTANSAQFQPIGASLFTPPSNADQQRQIALRQAKIQLHQKQMLLQTQQQFAQANGIDQVNNNTTLSGNGSPVPQFSPDHLTTGLNHTTPDKPGLSQSPPSPADSGVVADSKSENSNIPQDLLHNLEQSKLDEGLDFLTTSKSPVNSISFGPSSSSPAETTESALLSFTQPDDLLSPNVNSLGLSTSNSNFVADVSLGIPVTDETENNVTISKNLAAIWSTPTASMTNPEPITSSVDDIMLHALQQQQQQMPGWPNQLPTSFNSLTNPPPGLYNNAMLQKQLQQQQIQALHQQLALRRSQSTMLTQPNPINRSTSYQPNYLGGMNNMNGTKMNGLIGNPKSPSYSSWSNGQASLQSGWPASGGRSASLFNSLQHSTASSRLLNGSSALRKSSLSSQIVTPPRLNRSISTPAKYSHYMNGLGAIDDNPFFKMSDATGQNGLMALAENHESMGFSSLESQLQDIMRSSESQIYPGHNMGHSTAGLFRRRRGKWTDMNNDMLFEESAYSQIAPNLSGGFQSVMGELARDRFSRKVFVGGLPPDIDEDEIQASFRQFGPLIVDWPHKAESKSYFPPKGYAFLLFQDEMSVQNLISCCLKDGDKLYLRVSSPTIREKPVQIRPWNLADSDFVLDGSQPLDPRKTIFVGGVPRPLRAVELAMIMDRLYGGVCYAGIDVDPELKYPKGAGRVAFSNQQSYIAAISARFVQLQHGDIDKRVEVKPYVLDDQHCDECQGSRCGGKFAPFFCANVTCLQYYCEHCWTTIHTRPGREFHKPLVKEGADRTPRSMAYRW
ncbi:cytoplasmic polyadenylation element-binding protein 4-like isoform X1 [Clavelina lepadiformis]|uniref:cytoplasmic polyadenylation element-binding protein 4-like isoform X1 n=1 Tax=Clavelina lepadiformis TaxID=159417 RepID=UPI004043082F